MDLAPDTDEKREQQKFYSILFFFNKLFLQTRMLCRFPCYILVTIFTLS